MAALTRFDILDVDELRVRVLVENSIPMGNTQFRALHGLSMLVQSTYEGSRTNVLWDVGADPDVLFNNMQEMEIDPGQIDCIALSHNHSDHTGGLPKVIERIGIPGLPVIAHPAASRVTFTNRPHIRGGAEKDVRKEVIESAGGSFLAVSEPLEIAPGLFTSGYIERVTGEPTGLRTRVLEPDGTWHEDEVPDDLALVARVKGEGLVIVTGCSHSGIVNIIRHCTKITGKKKVSGIIGGFHLASATGDRIAWTIEEMVKTEPELVASGHCTGFDAEAALRQAFGKRYRHMTVGAEFVFPQHKE